MDTQPNRSHRTCRSSRSRHYSRSLRRGLGLALAIALSAWSLGGQVADAHGDHWTGPRTTSDAVQGPAVANPIDPAEVAAEAPFAATGDLAVVTDTLGVDGLPEPAGAMPDQDGGAALDGAAPAATVTWSVIGRCDTCSSIALALTGLRVGITAPYAGTGYTPFKLSAADSAVITLTAPELATAGGKTLLFRHWYSDTARKVLGTSRTLSATARASQTVAAVYGPVTVLPVQAVRLADNTSCASADKPRRPAVSPDQLRQWVDQANLLYHGVGLHLRFSAATTAVAGSTCLRTGPDWAELADKAINSMMGNTDPDWATVSAHANTVAAKYAGKLVVFFKWGSHPTSAYGGGFSWNDLQFVAMPFFATDVCAVQNINLFAHEVGHYLGLAHTFSAIFDDLPKADIVQSSWEPAAGDLDGDGKGDIVEFLRAHSGAVYAARSTGAGFEKASRRWHDFFGFGDERQLVGDFNGDGRADAATFVLSLAGNESDGDVFVTLSNGSHFAGASRWHSNFGYGAEQPVAGDFNGDGKDDVAVATGGAAADVFVALSDGARFSGDGWKWHDDFAAGAQVVRAGDVDGDGRDDLIAFTRGTAADVWVARSTGGAFGPVEKWHDGFAFGSETPFVGDFDGDRRADIVTFTRGSTGDVFVALSDGRRFNGNGWLWHGNFAYGAERPVVGDFSGDGRADIAAIGRSPTGDVYVATSTGGGFAGDGLTWHDSFDFAAAYYEGDGLDDTLPDPFIWTLQCPTSPTSVTIRGTVYPLPTTNVMSYWHPDAPSKTVPRVLSAKQGATVRGWANKRGFK